MFNFRAPGHDFLTFGFNQKLTRTGRPSIARVHIAGNWTNEEIETMVNDIMVTRSVLLNATPERVWEALTDPAMTRQYLYGCEVQCDWRQGSTMTWAGKHESRDINEKGRLLEVVPGRLIKYSGFDRLVEGDVSRQGDIHITHEIIPQAGKTKLLTTLEHFEGDEARAEFAAQQWDFEIMPRLRSLIEAPL